MRIIDRASSKCCRLQRVNARLLASLNAMRELQRRADANPDGASVLDTDLLTRWRIEPDVSTPSVPSDDDAATVEAASAETAPGDAHSWCVIS